PEPGADLTENEVVEYVRARLAGYKRPRYVELVDALPATTATGKVQKAVLRERFAAKYGTAPAVVARERGGRRILSRRDEIGPIEESTTDLIDAPREP
ncbi:MAG: AMP-binding enzyme, partial [Candidatus Dormibacteraceae bacterium]